MRANIERLLIGSSFRMRKVKEQIIQGIKGNVSIILISGESGTGKDLIARLIHANSFLQKKPFQEINCLALTDNIIKGSSDINERLNFEGISYGGTIFFNEVIDLSISVQVDLLGLLKNNTKPVKFIFATTRNLENAVHIGSLNADLYSIISTNAIYLPPLRNRGEDVISIAKYYLGFYSKIYDKKRVKLNRNIEGKLLSYSWPGNISELKHLIERFVLLEEKDILLPQEVTDNSWSDMEPGKIKPLAEVEREYILNVLDYFDNNKSRAAKALGITRQSVINKFKKYEHLN
ncbi:MAG: sigma-54-dependent transcriptional regulator [bacterium]